MGKYIDLCTVMDEDFFRVFVEDYCKDSDIRIIKKIIDGGCQEESEDAH